MISYQMFARILFDAKLSRKHNHNTELQTSQKFLVNN